MNNLDNHYHRGTHKIFSKELRYFLFVFKTRPFEEVFSKSFEILKLQFIGIPAQKKREKTGVQINPKNLKNEETHFPSPKKL